MSEHEWITTFFAYKQGVVGGYHVRVWRIGTLNTHVSLLIVGKMFDVGISLFGRRASAQPRWLP